MQKASAPVVIIIILLILISLSVAGGGFYLIQKEKTKGVELEQKLEQINTKQRITEAKLRDSEKLIADLQGKLDEAKTKIDSLSDELKKEKSATTEAAAQLDQLKSDLEEQRGFRSDLEQKLSQAQEELRKTVMRLKELDAKREELEAKVKDLEEKSKQIELGKIVVTPETVTTQVPEGTALEAPVPAVTPSAQAQPAAPSEAPVVKAGAAVQEITAGAGLRGKVLVINKDYNFAVINLGSKDGVKIQDVFSVYHNEKYTGDVKIEKVHDSMSAAGFVTSDTRDKIFEGDKVVQKVK